MAGMAGRIARVRGELRKSLESKMPAKDWSFVTSQIGMFSFTGLSPVQVGRGEGWIRGRYWWITSSLLDGSQSLTVVRLVWCKNNRSRT